MKTRYFFIVLLGLISFSCSCKKQATDTNTSTQTVETTTETSNTTNTSTFETGSSQLDDWSNQPNSSSSMIKVLNAANAFGSLPNGLRQMGYSITENTGTSLTTNVTRAISDDVSVKAWVNGNDIILSSQVQEYEETEFGLPQPSGLTSCSRGNSSAMPDCWRLILVVANQLGDEKQYR